MNRWLWAGLLALALAMAASAETRIGLWTGPGSWEQAAPGLRRAIEAAGATPVTLGPAAPTAAQLEPLAAVILPGGWAPELLAGLTPAGAAALETYVKGGGGVLAICASAYLAAAEGRWDDAPTIADPWSWLPARAVGPQSDLAPWPERAPVRLTRVDGEHTLQGEGELDACYFGGPALELRDGATALLRYPNGGVAGAACTAGKGRVVVLGPHLEVGPEDGQPPPKATTRVLAAYLRWIARSAE